MAQGRLLSQTDIPLRVRPFVPGTDAACITDGWVHSYRNSGWARSMHLRTYNATQRFIVTTLLARAVTLVGCAPDDDSTIYGWVCGEKQPSRIIVHYVWAKPFCRGCGVGSRLLSAMLEHSALPVVVSHLSDKVAKTMERAAATRLETRLTCPHRPYVRYNPMLSLNPNLEVAL